MGAATRFGSGDTRAAPLGPSVSARGRGGALLGAVPGPLDGSRARCCAAALERAAACGHERGLAAASRSPLGQAARGWPREQPACLGPRREWCGLCSAYTPFHCKQTASVSGEARQGCLPRGPFSLYPAKTLPHLFSSHVLAAGRLSARQRARCAWQVSHGASDGLSPEQVQQGSSSPVSPRSLLPLLFGPWGQL